MFFLLSKEIHNKDMYQKKEKQQYIRCRYTKDVHRTKWQALTIARLNLSPYTTKIERIRRDTLLSTAINCYVFFY